MNSSAEIITSPCSNKMQTPVDKISKLIDAQLDFNKLLMKQLMLGKPQERIKVFASFFLELSDIPTELNKNALSVVDAQKKDCIVKIVADIHEYEAIKKMISSSPDEIDQLYLYIYATLEADIFGLQNTNKKNFENFVSKLFISKPSNKMVNKIFNGIVKGSYENSTNIEVKIKKEMLGLLYPHISSCCKDFMGLFKFDLREGGDFNMDIPKSYLKGSADFIGELYENVSKFKNNELYRLSKYACAIAEKMVSGQTSSKSLPDVYIEIYQLYAVGQAVYNAANEIIKMLAMLEEQNNIAVSQNVMAEELKSLSASVIEVEEKKEEKIIHDSHSVSSTEVQSEVVDSVEKEENLSLPENAIKIEEEKEGYSFHKFFGPKNKTAAKSIEIKNKEKLIQIDMKKFESYKDDHHVTFLKVFGKIEYESISLRELINLVLALNGTIETTGANRCRIEIGGIYAYCLMSGESVKELPQNQCQKATITFHGSAQKQKKSQQQDGAPHYLVEQFKAAFERVGFTPDSLCYEFRSVVGGKRDMAPHK